jgi:hypothetical protein
MDGPMVGREQIREGSRPAMAAITDCRVEIRHLLVDGAVAMAEGYFASRLDDLFQGFSGHKRPASV